MQLLDYAKINIKVLLFFSDKLIVKMIDMVKKFDLDGIEIDFDYPGTDYRFYYRNFVQGSCLSINFTLLNIFSLI